MTKPSMCELGTCSQKEDDGKYTALAVMSGFDKKEDADNMCVIMGLAIDKYLNDNGLHGKSLKN